MVLSGAANSWFVREIRELQWAGSEYDSKLSTDICVSLPLRFLDSDEPSAPLAAWVYIVQGETTTAHLD